MAAFYENRQIPISARTGHGLTTAPHLHNHLEMVYLVRGNVYAAADDVTIKMKEGDLYLSFPNQIHYYPNDGCIGALEHRLIIFSPFVCREFKEFFRNSIPVSPVVPAEHLDPEIPLLIQRLCDTCKTEIPYKDAVIRGYLITLLGRLFASMEFRTEKQSDGYALKRILNYCNSNYKEPMSLDRIAEDLDIGKYHISHILSEKLHISFPDYVNGLRVNDAIQRLAEEPDTPVTDVAYACGFSSIRTFNRAFQKCTGTTPRQYREEHRFKQVKPINFYIYN